MKFTLGWLKDYLETNASFAEISEKLTDIGLEVENVVDHAAILKNFIVAQINSAKPHPNASKLQVCEVFDGSEVRQIVCGAANARAGIKVVLAREGVFIPGSGITIKKTKIRDVDSNGMLCSAEELGLDEKSEGIIELPETAVVGGSAASALGLDDAVIEIAITPNRGDCLGVFGIARDLAATGIGRLKPLKFPELSTNFQSPILVETLTSNCPHFCGYYIRGVKNSQSPEWLQARLRAIGLKPISALVDVTNYICMSFARPLHVFDAKNISGKIRVRQAENGEKLQALNEKEYVLNSEITVIADDEKALGIAGIMGGIESGCTLDTTDVFLESAWFEPVAVAKAGRSLDILSDARYRFERSTDPEFVAVGAKIAAAMIVEFCGGQVSELVSVKTSDFKARQIGFNPEKVELLSGVRIDEVEISRILAALGFDIKEHGKDWVVTVPSWRADVCFEADIVEEIVRIRGYAEIPSTALPQLAGFKKPKQSSDEIRAKSAREALKAIGYLEACSYSFISTEEADKFDGGDLKLQNPISVELAVMRPSLLPSLLAAAKRNGFRGSKSVELFEVGLSYHGLKPDEQALRAAGIKVGATEQVSFDAANMSKKPRAYDVFDAKMDVFYALEALGVNTSQIKLVYSAPAYFHPGRSALITLGGKVILGVFGELHPNIAKFYELVGSVVGFELNLQNVPEARAKKAKQPLVLNELQPLERDFAFTVSQKNSAEELIKAAVNADKQLITSAEVFDVYVGSGAVDGTKSIAVRINIQPRGKTLADLEIQAICAKVVDAAKAIGAELRSS